MNDERVLRESFLSAHFDDDHHHHEWPLRKKVKTKKQKKNTDSFWMIIEHSSAHLIGYCKQPIKYADLSI